MTPSPRATRATLCLTMAGLLPALLTACSETPWSGPSGGPAQGVAPSVAVGFVVGPTGLGPLHLGMTIEQAEQTHMFGTLTKHPTVCSGASSADGTVIKYSAKYGVTLIGEEHGRTPEGIGAGSTFADVEKTYPDPADPELGTFDEQLSLFHEVVAPVPGNPAADYTITFDPRSSGRVRYVYLTLKAERDC